VIHWTRRDPESGAFSGSLVLTPQASVIVGGRMKLIRWAAAVSLGFVASAAGAQTASMPDVSLFAVGDLWEWRQFDNRTKLDDPAITRLVVEEKGVREFVAEGMRRPLVWAYVAEPSSKPWRVWPLEVGKRWSIDMDFVSAGGSGNMKMDARVLAYEEVVVPAGKFMAFKIEHDGFVSTGNFNGRMVETFWYAPDARADAKHVRRVARTDFTRELVKYPRPGQQPATAQKPTAPAASAAAPVQPPAPPTATQPAAETRASRLRELEQLRKEGLITQQEYDEKRKALLSTL
jgi:hypothetical protein